MNMIFLRIKLFILLSYARLKGKAINFWKRLWFNRNKSQDTESYIDDISEISVLESKEYDALFLNKSSTSPIYMPRATLSKIISALPKNYVFPGPDINKLLQAELEKYNHKKIDQQIIERIQKQLPQNYILHNPFVFNNHPVIPLMGNSNNMDNHKVQGQISNNLPTNYKFN